jgi:hypothetical protein
VDLVTLGGYAAMVVCGVLILWAALWALRGRAVVLKQLIVGGVVEALLLVQVIAAAVGLVGGREIAEPAVFWGYLVVALMLLPAGAVVAIAERSRWSSVVLLVIAFALLVMEYRILTLWWMEGGAS